jgi:hypothetical protein
MYHLPHPEHPTVVCAQLERCSPAPGPTHVIRVESAARAAGVRPGPFPARVAVGVA